MNEETLVLSTSIDSEIVLLKKLSNSFANNFKIFMSNTIFERESGPGSDQRYENEGLKRSRSVFTRCGHHFTILFK